MNCKSLSSSELDANTPQGARLGSRKLGCMWQPKRHEGLLADRFGLWERPACRSSMIPHARLHVAGEAGLGAAFRALVDLMVFGAMPSFLFFRSGKGNIARGREQIVAKVNVERQFRWNDQLLSIKYTKNLPKTLSSSCRKMAFEWALTNW